ncbi:hypothetical protein JDV02_010273 [Purpureocillium takamizusanense]|uniref:Uncharacterized protein n=1 Tax=Purpureocillium takamizusanense TaxID=2060973 RepID=A0A9Q8QSD8_9HYPO|nr:uncharacterized protein JDV02_010273 [Purpureocillium takamizusanense]UNI24537.1 hypothetical protein JDV02_010273 [Purpureocillium takamizusanense]
MSKPDWQASPSSTLTSEADKSKQSPTPSNAAPAPASTMQDEKDEARLRAEAAYRWGKTPSSSGGGPSETDPARLPANHPVHKIPPEKQDEMRSKGINPVLRAEMDEATKGQGKARGFWSKYGLTSTGPWMR